MRFWIGLVLALVVVSLEASPPARAGAEVDRYVGVVADGSARSDIEATLEIRPIGAHDRLLVIRESRAGKPIVAYDNDPTLPSPMHLVAVSRDLARFVPLRPQLDASGDFTVIFNPPHAGPYLLYAVATPQGLGEHAFRFEFPVKLGSFSGAVQTNAIRDETPRHVRLASLVARVDGYVVTLDTKAQTVITATVRHGDKPPTDFSMDFDSTDDLIDATTLAYRRVHAFPADLEHTMRAFPRRIARARPSQDADHAAKATLVVEPTIAGTYALAFRFHADGADHVATFFIDAR